jgi:pimeloyl-ACP methyl ester carboxylesterase
MKLAHRVFPGLPGAPTLLLLHGVTRNGRDWEPLLPELTRHWRVIVADHCGHGSSPRTPGEYRVADYARHTAEFLRASVSERVTVMGHSLGAMVALWLAAECAPLVAAIVLEDPPFHTMGRDIASTPYLAQFVGMAEVARRGGDIAAMANGLAAIRLSPTRRLGDVRDRASLEWIAECLAQVDPEVFTPLVAGRWLDGFEARDLWPRVGCPVLLLQGDPAAGGAFTDADALSASRALRTCRHVRFAGTGHQIHRTRPAEVLAAVRDFVHSSTTQDELPKR